MISLHLIPSSIARRVRTGRQSMARRRSSIGERARDIGFRASKATPLAPRWKAVRRRGKAACMKLGVHIGYWGLGLTSADQLEIVLEAERLGYDSVWTAEAYGSDAATILGWVAQATSRIRIGSGGVPRPRRPGAVEDPDRLGDLPDAGPLGGDDRDDRRDARPAVRRADDPRHRLQRAA